MKTSYNFLLLFTLISFLWNDQAYTQTTYEDLEIEQSSVNDSLHHTKFIYRLGFSHMPTRFSEASIVSDIPFLPYVEADLPSVNVSNGLQFGMHFLMTENWFAGFDFSYLFSSRQEGRRRDNIGIIGLTGGYMFPLQNWNKNHLLSIEGGFGVQVIDRPVSRTGGYRVTLTRMDYLFSPGVRYEFNIFKEKVYLFSQLRYHHQLGRLGSRSGLKFERSREDYVEIFPLNDPDLIVSPATRLDTKSNIEFSIGVRINL